MRFPHRLLAAPALGPPLIAVAAGTELPTVTVFKSPACECCDAWVDHMRAAGFHVEVQDVSDKALAVLKRRPGVASQHASCHTAEDDGYFVEGHVPADDVKRLLAEHPAARGLAVLGMPAGSPGMETGDTRDPYDTLLIGMDGQVTDFANH
jgi:hypothetical protein